MPWVPTTDFEEEVVNLQPDLDFIYGTLSEQQYTYPRPQAHVEYVENKRIKKQNEQEGNAANKNVNAKLKVIAEVQRIANSKPMGELPTIEDWDNNAKTEQEIVSMLRHCGIAHSVEQPLSQEATISTYPVENTIKVIKTGRKKLAYFYDDNVFQLKQKVSDSSSDFEHFHANDSLVSDRESLTDTTATSLSSHSFSTCDNSGITESFTSALIDQQSSDFNPQLLGQYEKLLEDTRSLSISSKSANSTTAGSTNSFQSTKENENSWKPLPDDYDVENIFNNCKEWPGLGKNEGDNDVCNLSLCSDGSHKHKNNDSNSIDINSTISSCGSSSGRSDFFERFIEPEQREDSPASAKTSKPANNKNSSCKAKTSYASIAKESKNSKKSKAKSAEEIDPFEFVPFYTPRKMYALKRGTAK